MRLFCSICASSSVALADAGAVGTPVLLFAHHVEGLGGWCRLKDFPVVVAAQWWPWTWCTKLHETSTVLQAWTSK